MTDANKPADKPFPATPPSPPQGALATPAKPPTIEGKPVEPKLSEQKPGSPTASAAKPAETKSADAKSAETRTAETKMGPSPVPPTNARPASAPPPPKPASSWLVDSKSTNPPPAAAPHRATGTPAWLSGIAFVLLAGGLYWVWQDRAQVASPTIQALQNDLRTAQQRIATLEQRPIPTPDTSRIAAVETAVRTLANKPADTSALEQRLAALEAKPAPVIPDVAHDVEAAMAGANAEFNAKIASLDSKLQQDLARTTRLRAATADLDAGKPLGDLPGATAALQRFATLAPPTEPALRQSFPGFAATAEKASQPTGEGQDFAARMWGRAQQLVTVRQGDKVLVGAPAAVTLAASRTKLDAGDLAGAVAALGPLDPPAAAAMAPWKRDAQALLDARASLAAMATKS